MPRPLNRALTGALSLALIGGLTAVTIALPAQSAAADPVVSIPSVSVRSIAGSEVYAVSKSGRHALVGSTTWGSADWRMQLRDTKTNRRLKTFPAGVDPLRVSISDDGRYVTYTLPGVGTSNGKSQQRDVRVYDRKTGKTRSAVTTRTGKPVRPAWTAPCTSDCDEDWELTDYPRLDGGQISGNGRYIVYCANYARPERVDLYLKNWKTKKLTRIDGACDISYDSDVNKAHLNRPSISDDGNTVLLPGTRESAEEGEGTWGPSRVLRNRKSMIEVGGTTPTMTHDGKTISTRGAFASAEYVDSEEPLPVEWVHLPTGARTPSDPPGLQLTMENASRHGRYVLTAEGVRDRITGVLHDLPAALTAAGFPTTQMPPDALITGDGKTVVMPLPSGGWNTVRWMN